MIEAVRSAVLAGPHPLLTESERLELIDFFTEGEDIEPDWWYDPESPDRDKP